MLNVRPTDKQPLVPTLLDGSQTFKKPPRMVLWMNEQVNLTPQLRNLISGCRCLLSSYFWFSDTSKMIAKKVLLEPN